MFKKVEKKFRGTRNVSTSGTHIRNTEDKEEFNEHNRDTEKDPFKGTSIEGKD